MRMRTIWLTLLTSLALFSPVRGDSLSVGFSDGVLNTTPAIVNFKTTGSDMNGMAVTFKFTDNTTATSFWLGGSNSVGSSGGATLSLTGDSYFTQWSLNNASGLGITSMVIDAGLGNTAFDLTWGNLFGTTNSSSGKTFNPTTGKTGLDIVATYSDKMAVNPNSAVGDLYRTLTVQFTNNGGLATGTTMNFWADTDTIEPPATSQGIQTPAPPALLLALFGAPLLFRRRK